MLDQSKNYIKKLNLFDDSSRLLLAVSGGIDSMVCLSILHKLGYKCGVAHCNFQLRGAESDGDEEFVQSVSKRMHVSFHCKTFNTEEYANNHSLSIQMAARELRYEWFKIIMESEDYDHLILAHHGDDSVETLLINLARGTSLKGLTGIQAINGNIRRPLLFSSRSEIEEFASENGIEHREDSSNKKTEYKRNHIRHIIIPEFEKLNPSFRKTVLTNINYLRQEQSVLDDVFNKLKLKIVSSQKEEIRIEISSLLNLASAEWFLYRYLSEFGFNADQVEALFQNIISNSGKQFFSAEYLILIDREYIYITKRNVLDERSFFIAESIELISTPISLKFETISIIDHKLSTDPNIASIDKSKILFPLTLRRWIQGDSFYPLGMNKQKKLSDFFIDQKVPRHKKEQTWILCSGDEIVWIIGFRLDDRYKITDKSTEILHIRQLD